MSSPEAEGVHEAPSGPPYPPRTASLGGTPTKTTDIPLSAVFLVIFMGSAAAHMIIFQLNRRKGHKFLLSGVCFGFSMARITTMVMRIVWACYPRDVRIAIAASIFAAAGVLLIYVANLIFAQRILRAAHPRIGWHPAVGYAFKALWFMIPLILVMLITVLVQSFYSLNPNTHRIDHDIQIFAQAFLTLVAFLPIPIVVFSIAIPRRNNRRVDKFGLGRWRTKVAMVLGSSSLLLMARCFIATSTWVPVRPITHPGWFDSKAVFWVFYFTCEAIVIWLFVILRTDMRFHVPDHSKGSYGQLEGQKQGDKLEQTESNGSRILSEDELVNEIVSGDMEKDDSTGEKAKGADLA